MKPIRFTAAAASAFAASAGIMASRSGSATVAPAPRRNDRRGIDSFLMNINVSFAIGDSSRPSHSKGRAADDAANERDEPIIVAGGIADNRANRRRIVVFDAAAERVR